MKIYIHNLKNKVGSTRAARLDFASTVNSLISVTELISKLGLEPKRYWNL